MYQTVIYSCFYCVIATITIFIKIIIAGLAGDNRRKDSTEESWYRSWSCTLLRVDWDCDLLATLSFLLEKVADMLQDDLITLPTRRPMQQPAKVHSSLLSRRQELTNQVHYSLQTRAQPPRKPSRKQAQPHLTQKGVKRQKTVLSISHKCFLASIMLERRLWSLSWYWCSQTMMRRP